jgi:hypothetical protein
MVDQSGNVEVHLLTYDLKIEKVTHAYVMFKSVVALHFFLRQHSFFHALIKICVDRLFKRST